MFKKIASFLLKHWPLFLSFCIILIAFHAWINPGGYLTSGDWPFYYKDFLLSAFSGFPQVWISYWGFGGVDYAAAFDILKFLYSAISHIADYNISERLLYFWPIIIISPISSYIFLSHILKNKISIFVGMLIFLCNIYTLMLSTGDITLMIANGFAPLIFYLFSYSLEKNKFKFAIFNALIVAVSLSYEPRATYVILWILFLYYLFYIMFIDRLDIVKKSLLAAANVIPAFMLGAYWIFPLIASKSIVNNSLFARGLFGDQFLNISYAITLFHPFWTGEAPAIFVNQPIPWYFWAIPIIAFLGLYHAKKSKKIIFFGFIALLGILLTKQSGYPFHGLYLWLYEHFPGFNAFREASKFYFLIIIGYGVLIGSFIDWLWIEYKIKRIKLLTKVTLTVAIIATFLFNLKPLVTGEIQNLFFPRTVPKNYLIEKNDFSRQREYFRIMWVPTYSRWTSFTVIHPALSLTTIMSSDWNSFSLHYNPLLSQSELFMQFLSNPMTKRLFAVSSIKYLYLPFGDKTQDDNIFIYYGNDKNYLINKLNNISWLRGIVTEKNNIDVYENKTYRPHIYTTQEKETITKDIPYKKIQYSFINPTQYTLILAHVEEPLYVNFSESFNPNWRMRIGNFNWLDVILKKDYFLPANWHFQNDATLNSYYLDPKIACKIDSCIKNTDGTFTLHATLYFVPQSYMYVGLIISGSTLVLLLGYLGFVGCRLVKKKYEKNTK